MLLIVPVLLKLPIVVLLKYIASFVLELMVPLLLKLLIVDLLLDFPQTVIANLEEPLPIMPSLAKVSIVAPF
ncbi:hypothetical protein THJ066_03940 [Campylobacter jejuni]|nr:hypothetical protein THJ066_03940 [Campylobacter jejuni]GKY71598.1 hypothetical protein THJ103_07150 [Campylobacter jejuni]